VKRFRQFLSGTVFEIPFDAALRLAYNGRDLGLWREIENECLDPSVLLGCYVLPIHSAEQYDSGEKPFRLVLASVTGLPVQVMHVYMMCACRTAPGDLEPTRASACLPGSVMAVAGRASQTV
jgi:hypothetical protein